MCLFNDLHRIAAALESIAHSLERLANATLGPEVVGIVVEPSPQTQSPTGESVMARPKCTYKKALPGATAAATTAKAKAAADVLDFVITDDGSSVCTVYGVDARGAQVDVSALATLTPAPTSSDSTKITVDPPSAMTFAMHAVAVTTPGSPVSVTATATFNDGSRGPFTFTLPCDVVAGGVTGITIQPGPVTVS